MLAIFQLQAQTTAPSNLEFVENKGQWDPEVKFRAKMGTGTIYLQKKGFTILLEDTADLIRMHAMMHGESLNYFRSSPKGQGNSPARGISGAGILHTHVYRVSFENASDDVQIIPDKPLLTYDNYFIGNDQSKWASNCKLYQGVIYKNIYAGIDIHYYTEGGMLKYDLVVHPGANPDLIAMKYDGQQQLSIKKNQLLIGTSVGLVREWIPRAYQSDEKGKSDIAVNYTITGGNIVKFKIKNYSPAATLVIDPQEKFCSFTKSSSDNWGYTATYDAQGDFYAGGIVLADGEGDPSGNGFPASVGAFQGKYQGGDNSEGSSLHYDVAIIKLSPDGFRRMYATYLGAGGDEQPHSMIVDNAGNLVVAGRTSSATFPALPVEANSYDERGFDIFLTKFSADGQRLIGSRRIGGTGSDGVNFKPKYISAGAADDGTKELRLNYGDDGRSEVILDAANNIYLASCTQSSDFPVVGGFQAASGGGQDGVLIKTNPDLSTILFSSYLGGSKSDAAFALSLNPMDNTIYVAGGTLSADLLGTGNGPVLHNSSLGGVDGFISVVSNDGSSLIRTTYFGTDGTDMIYGIQFDKAGFPYITGTTTKVIPIVNSPFNQSHSDQANGKQFITKLKPDLSDVVYSVNFGAKGGSKFPNISPTAFLVDRCQNVYVAGWGGGIDIGEGYDNSGTTDMLTTADAIRGTSDGGDFYFFVLQRDAATQLYGSFFGQVNGHLGDHVDGGTSRFDKQGIIYEAICANCGGGARFPTTAGVWGQNNPLANTQVGCNEAAVKIAFNFAGVGAGLKSTLRGRGDSLGCIPLEATLEDTIRNAKTYVWDFGDGSPVLTTPDYLQPHTYTAVGTYRVMLVAIDSSSCNVADTAYLNITARNDAATLDFRYAKVGDCKSTDYDFFNLSTPSPGKSFTDSSFAWYFSDLPPGTQIPAGPIANTTNHAFPGPGTYNVTLMLIDTNFCNYPGDTTKILSIAQNVKAQLATPANGCAPYNAVFDNTSLGGQQFYWDFGDNSGSTDRTPAPHLYASPGTYIIRLKVVDSSTCNIADSTTFTLTVNGKPTAAFTFSPIPPAVNTKTVFYNNSSGGVRYTWLFGDGESTVKTTLDTVEHQYNVTDTFNACLIAVNQVGCADTVCHPVAALVHPLLDVPNAFTPGRFGVNGVVKVVGFGITHMSFRIYNRWGQLVFESNDRNLGWDGTYRGVVQPMDVYGYTLEAEYFDGTRATKKGDITLIR
ncbi:MAG TPA: PKD domain-containing protein [Puia sp.]|nr:PKD domain-containing protein [Puia sp.]